MEVEPSTTVAALKGRIEAEHGHPTATQKLIYSGECRVICAMSAVLVSPWLTVGTPWP